MHVCSPLAFWFWLCWPWDLISVCLETSFPSVSFLWPLKSSSCPYPSTILPKGFADLCTSSLGHSLPYHHLCTHTRDQSVSSDLTEDIKHGACTTNVLTETRAQGSCTLGLNLSMTYGAGTFLTGFKIKHPSGRWGEVGEADTSSAVPTPDSHYLLTTSNSVPTLLPCLFWVTKNRQKQPEERFLDYFVFLHVDGDINAALGSIILGGYVYRVKYILPNQETE